MRIILLLSFIVGMTTCSWAELKTKNIEYLQGDTVLEGYLSYDDHFTGKRPGVLVAHEWMGLNDYARMRADMLARLGFIAFAVDIYGKDIHPKNVQEAGAESSRYKNNRLLLQERIKAGLVVLKGLPDVDPSRLAAIGYCFGGTAVLELARSGADIKGVVSFHGGLSNPIPQDAANIKGEVLVLQGADDPFVPPREVEAFEQEMKEAKVRYQLIKYPGALHGFTNPANTGELKGALYNAQADTKSWSEMQHFLERVLK